jgi:hydroxymethylglutaryl-CoA synthase
MGENKVGIVSAGLYLPQYRIKRQVIAEAWGRPGGRGEKAIAYYDEDAVTLAIEAAFNCLAGIDPDTVDGLFFASASGPYGEKEHANLIKAVIDLKATSITADFSHSLRAGAQAMRAAVDSVGNGSTRNVLVTSADHRATEPGSEPEMDFGDGAASVLIGSTGLLAELEGSHSLSHEFTDFWRRNQDPYVRWGDPQFTFEYGYRNTMRECISGLLEKQRMEPKDIQKVALYTPDFGGYRRVARDCGFHLDGQVLDPLYNQVGIIGSAHCLLLLASALEGSQPGDYILVAAYGGGGSDAFIFRTTERISQWSPRRPLSHYLEKKKELPHTNQYNQYLRFTDCLKLEVSPPFTKSTEPFTSLAFVWKEIKQDMGFYGSRCLQCGHVQFPMRRVCLNCHAKDQMEDHKLAKKGTVYTFTKDFVFLTPNPPGIMAAVDLEGGGRFFGQMTECSEDEIAIGLPVELTYRKWHEGLGICHYFWKCRAMDKGK